MNLAVFVIAFALVSTALVIRRRSVHRRHARADQRMRDSLR